ncbi:MAG: hypothetical protein QHJ73_00075, partial [Armatimonadota bacterium]|nr:hypothetical protein [Armatimonadota bacterium]
IAHASSEARARGFRDFKESRKPFVVIRLRGDVQQSLPEQLFRGIEQALKEHPGLAHVALPFWFQEAEKWLNKLSPPDEERANAYLAQRQPPLDLPALRTLLAHRDPDVHEVVRELFYHFHEVYPDFGGQVNLADAIRWLADTACGENGPAGGVIILFDEFSAFIRSYVSTPRVGTHAAPLQDLLSGVANCRKDVLFVAFAQWDPSAEVDALQREAGDNRSGEDVRKELTRLPQSQFYSLHSSLESVLDAYLKKSERWKDLRKSALSAVVDARDWTEALFPDRYNSENDWSTERLEDEVVKGCFPLHPVATALLCSVDLHERGAGGRRVLQLLYNLLEERKNQPALCGDTPNWTYATVLVDWFGEMLDDNVYRDYDSVVRRLGAEATGSRAQVLKAMLLLTVARLPWRRIPDGYPRAISQLCGLPLEECEAVLQELEGGGFIRQESTGAYSFYPAGTGADILERKIQDKIRHQRIEDVPRQELGQLLKLEEIPIDKWVGGHPEDNCAAQHVFLRPHFTAEELRKVLVPAEVKEHGSDSALRAHLIWCVALCDDDVQWFRGQAASVLAEALKDQPNPPAVVVALPETAQPNFARAALKLRALENLPQTERAEFGEEVLNQANRRYEKGLEEQVNAVCSAREFEVPQPYRDEFRAEMARRRHPTSAGAVEGCVAAAYPSVLPFFTHYKARANSLMRAVQEVSTWLATGAYDDIGRTAQNGRAGWDAVAKELIIKYLREGQPDSWELLTADFQPRDPSSSKVKKAWKVLEDHFPPGAGWKQVGPALTALLNPPFGCSCQQAMLLFCAWYGRHRHYLHVHHSKQRRSLGEILKEKNFKPRQFISEFTTPGVYLARTDPDEASREVQQVLERIGKPLASCEEVREWKASLEEFVANDGNDPNRVAEVREAVQLLSQRLEEVEAYLQAARKISDEARSARSVSKLADEVLAIRELPQRPGWIAVDASLTEEKLREDMMRRLREQLDCDCERYARLSGVEDFGLYEKRLKEDREALERVGNTELLEKVDAALARLKSNYEGLQAEAADAPIRLKLEAMHSKAPLAELRRWVAELATLQAHTAKTRDAINAKRHELDEAIEHDEAYVRELDKRLEGVASARDARSLKEEILENRYRFEESRELERVDAVKERCENLEDLLNRLEGINPHAANNPEAVEELLRQVDRLEEGATELGQTQRASLGAKRMELRKYLERRQREAREWLARLRAQVERGERLYDAREELQRGDPFLPAEDRNALEELRKQLQARLEEDEIQAICERFKRITDPSRRKKCLEQLLRLAELGA